MSELITAATLKKELISKMEELQQITDCNAITLYLYDADRLYFPLGIGLLNETRSLRSVPSRKRVAGKIIRSKKEIVADDAQHHPDITGPFTLIENIHSAAGFPLIDKRDNLQGIVFVNYREAHHFTGKDINATKSWCLKISEFLRKTFVTNKGESLKTSLRMTTDQRRKEHQLADVIERIREVLGDVDIVLWIKRGKENALDVSVTSHEFPREFLSHTEISIDQKDQNSIVAIFSNRDEKGMQISNLSQQFKAVSLQVPDGTSRREFLWKTAFLMPVFSENRDIGVLCVLRRGPLDFSPYEQKILSAFARLMAVTIRNEDRIIIQNALHDLGISLAVVQETDNILNKIVRSACDILDADIATILQYDPKEKTYLPIEDAAVYPEKAREKMEIPRPDGSAHQIIKKQRLFVENVAPNSKTASPFIQDQGIRAYAGLPLVSKDQPLGILYVSFNRPRKFSPDDKALLQFLADQAAAAIRNASLHQDVKLRVNALEKLHRMGEDLVSISDKPRSLADTLRRIAENAQNVLEADLVDLYEYHQELDKFDLPPIQLGVYKYPKITKKEIYRDDVIYGVLNRSEDERTKPIYNQDAQAEAKLITSHKEREDAPDKRFVVREGIASSAMVPLVAQNEVVGMLFANFRKPQSFSKQQRELIELFANQAAIAIHNSRLFQESVQKSARLDLVREVAAQVSFATDNNQILQFAVEGLAKVFEVKQATVALFDDNREYANVKFEHLEDECVPAIGGEGIPIKGNPHIARILKTKKPLCIDDVANDPLMESVRDIMDRRNTLSLMVVPIVVEDEVIGTIGIDSVGELRYFTEEEANLAQAIADQAAAAIRIARQLDERVNDIETLQEISGYVHRGEEGFNQMLNLVADRAVEMTGAKYGGVWLLNKTRDLLDVKGVGKAAQDYPQELPNIHVGPNSEESINKWVLENKKPHLSPDVQADENYMAWYEDTCSELCVPLLYGEKVIGTINVESTHVAGFTKDHQRLLEAMAGQVAVAVENARLIEGLDMLDDVGSKLTAGIRKTKDDVIELIFQQTQELTGAQDMYIALYNEETGEISFPWATEKGERVEYSSRKANMKERGKTEEIIFTKKTILHKTKQEAVKWYNEPGHQEFVGVIQASWLGVPIIVNEKVLGVLAVYDMKREHIYDEQDQRLLTSMVSFVPIALDNAELYYDINQQLERRIKALSALNAIGGKLTGSIRLTEVEILELIFAQAQKLLGKHDMYLALYSEETEEISFPLATEKGKRVKYESRKANEERRGKTDEIIFTREPILHKTQQEADEWYAKPRHGEFVGHISPSWIGVPMLGGKKVLGVIAAVDEEEYVFDELHLEVLSSMAAQAAIALENARLFEEARGEVIAAKQLSTLGTAIAALQHRINNTFNIIIPNMTRLRSRVNLNDPTTVEILDIIERNARYTSTIIARIQEPLKEVEVTNVKINAILDTIILGKRELWKASITKPIVDIKFDADENIPIIRGPSGQIAEVFDNLLGNAYKAMPQGGRIRVKSELNNGIICIKVMDSGVGISEEIQNRLFEKPVPSREPGAGAGLGLWLSRLMLQSIGGNIKVESSSKKGTTMLVTIPIHQSKKEVAR